MSLFATEMFFEMAMMEISVSLITLGQFVGATFIFLSILTWKSPDIAGDSVKSFGLIWALGALIWTGIVGYHIAIGVARGATAIGNIAIFVILGILYYATSKSKD